MTRGMRLTSRRLWALILLFLAAQVWFELGARGLRPGIEEMPPAPTERALKAMALGDDEFLYRHLARWMQFVGDGGGRVRPLYQYDYDQVVAWLESLDRLDRYRSDYVHELAARYFGEITAAVDPQGGRERKIVEYLRLVALRDPARFWKWLVWGSQRARNPIGDPALIETLARDLQSPELKDKAVPAWVRVLPVRLYEAAGDPEAAKEALARITPEDRAEIAAMTRNLFESVKRLKQGEAAPAPPPQK